MAMKPAGLIGTFRPGNRFCRVRNCPRTKVTLGRTAARARTASPCQPRAALAVERSEKDAGIFKMKVPALHREAEHDTSGSIGRQHSVHTWIGVACKGSVAPPATLCFIHQGLFKLRLTVPLYCGMRLLGGIVGEPR